MPAREHPEILAALGKLAKLIEKALTLGYDLAKSLEMLQKLKFLIGQLKA